MIAISRTGRLLRRLVRLSCRRPLVTTALSLILAVAGIAYTLHALSFKTSGRDLLPKDAGYVVRYNQYARDFGELEDIVIVIEAPAFEAAKDYAARLVQELRASPINFPRVAYRVDPKRFEGRQLLYLPVDQLKEVREKIFDHQEFMESFAGDPSLARLIEGANAGMASAFVSNMFDLGLGQNSGEDTRFLRLVLDQIAGRIDRPTPYYSPWGTLFSLRDHAPDAGYFLSDDKSLLFVLVETPEHDKGSFMGDRRAIEIIRDVIADLKPAFPEVQAGVTGGPTLSNDEMTAAFQDSTGATVLAFALTLLVMLLAFWRVGKPLLMLAVLTVTLAWSMGIITLTVGHLTIFSVMFISIVIGLGIDYGIYFLFRYEEEIFLGRNLKEALELTAARTGPGILIGALTAGGTFYVLMLTDFRGIQELGFIAGTAILMAWLGMMTTFPALLVLVDSHHAERPRNQAPRAHALERMHVPVLDRVVRFPTAVLTVAGLATAASLWAIPYVGFDYNLLNLQAKGTESVVWEKRILANTGRSGFNGLASATTLEELRRKQEAFEKLPSVSEVDSVLRIIPDNQKEKIAIVKSFAPVVAPVRVGRSSPVDLDRLTRALGELKRRLDIFHVEAGSKLPEDLKQLRVQVTALIKALQTTNREVAEPALSHLQSQLYRDFIDKFFSLPPQGGHLGAHGSAAFRARPQVGRSRRDGRADHHLRGHRLHGAGVLPGHDLRVPAGGVAVLPADQEGQGDAAGAPAAGPGALVDDRPHAGLRRPVQHGQCLGPAAHHRRLGGVRAQRDGALPRGARPRRPAGGAQHRHGGRALRHQHDGRIRQPHDRATPGHLQPGTAPDDRSGLRPGRQPCRPSRYPSVDRPGRHGARGGRGAPIVCRVTDVGHLERVGKPGDPFEIGVRV